MGQKGLDTPLYFPPVSRCQQEIRCQDDFPRRELKTSVAEIEFFLAAHGHSPVSKSSQRLHLFQHRFPMGAGIHGKRSPHCSRYAAEKLKSCKAFFLGEPDKRTVGDPSLRPYSAAGKLFNPLAFAVPPAGLWGNAGRNTIPGPMVVSLNASAGRVFRLRG